MGNYTSYLNGYGDVEGSFPVNTEMDISDSSDEETLVINRSYSDSALEIISESKKDKIIAAIGELEINNNRVQNAISCVYMKKQMESGFREKIEELTEKLRDTEDQVDHLHYINTRLEHKHIVEIQKKNNEIKETKDQLRIMKFQYHKLCNKKHN